MESALLDVSLKSFQILKLRSMSATCVNLSNRIMVSDHELIGMVLVVNLRSSSPLSMWTFTSALLMDEKLRISFSFCEMVMDGGGNSSFLRQPYTSVESRIIAKSVVFFIVIMF